MIASWILRPSELKTQCTKEVLHKGSQATWTRTQVRNNSPRLFRLSYWATSKNTIVRWLPACGILAIVVSEAFPKNSNNN